MNGLILKHSKGTVMSGLLIGGFIGMFSESALNIALSRLMTEFSVNAATIQWLTTGYLLVVGILLPLSGLLVRCFSTRQLMFTALTCFLTGAVISGLAVTFPVLLAGRLVQGAATGILLPLVFNTAIAIYPSNQIGAAMGVIGLVVMFAPALGPAVSGVILWKLSWKWIFWLMIPVIAASWIVSFLFLENVREIIRPKTDALSIVLSSIGFGLMVFGISFAGDNGWGDIFVIVSLIAGAGSLALFCRRQLKLEEPILNIRAFRSSSFSIGTALVFIDNAIIMAFVFLLPLYLQNDQSTPILVAGILMLPGGAVNGLVSALSGRLYDKYGAKFFTRTGFFIAAAAVLLMLFLDKKSHWSYVVLAHVVLMIGAPLAMSPAQAYGLSSLPERIRSDGSCIISTLQQIAGAVGTALAASFLSFGTNTFAFSTDYIAVSELLSGTKVGFLLPFLLAVLGFALAFKVKDRTVLMARCNIEKSKEGRVAS